MGEAGSTEGGSKRGKSAVMLGRNEAHDRCEMGTRSDDAVGLPFVGCGKTQSCFQERDTPNDRISLCCGGLHCIISLLGNPLATATVYCCQPYCSCHSMPMEGTSAWVFTYMYEGRNRATFQIMPSGGALHSICRE